MGMANMSRKPFAKQICIKAVTPDPTNYILDLEISQPTLNLTKVSYGQFVFHFYELKTVVYEIFYVLEISNPMNF